MMNLYIGYDRREDEAYRVAVASAAQNSNSSLAVQALDAHQLYRDRLLWRPIEHHEGRMFDHLSGSHQSTMFATSRFLVPYLQRGGWALFVDCDVVFLADVAELFDLADNRYAVMCVKHEPLDEAGIKMDGQPQIPYSRKNWSSVVLWNCDHRAHLMLNVPTINAARGLWLHSFGWLCDDEIGALPAEWNWLVGVQPKPAAPKIAHFTKGGPWLPGWQGAEHDEIWYAARDRAKRAAA